MAGAVFFTLAGILTIFFYIRWNKSLKELHDKQMKKLELEIGKLLMRGDQDE